jgi:hypothetical protein
VPSRKTGFPVERTRSTISAARRTPSIFRISTCKRTACWR